MKNKTNRENYGTLINYKTGESIRDATEDELLQSIRAAKTDGGSGVFLNEDGDSVAVIGCSYWEVEQNSGDRWNVCHAKNGSEFLTEEKANKYLELLVGCGFERNVLRVTEKS